MAVTVEVATAATEEVVEAFNRLVPQLSKSAAALTTDDVAAMINHQACHVLIARDDDASILGALTLVIFPIPTATRAWIEDVVVDGNARGKGVGEALSLRAVEISRQHGAKTVELTSRPSREAANRLYQRIGFVARDTNVYRYTLSDQHRDV
jgi:ribosomal protein S18 acetylase RimI-like enzyme